MTEEKYKKLFKKTLKEIIYIMVIGWSIIILLCFIFPKKMSKTIKNPNCIEYKYK